MCDIDGSLVMGTSICTHFLCAFKNILQTSPERTLFTANRRKNIFIKTLPSFEVVCSLLTFKNGSRTANQCSFLLRRKST